MKTINVSSSNGAGISVGSKYSALFQDIVVTAKNRALWMVYSDGLQPQTFTNVTATSQNQQAINIERSTKMTFTNITATANSDNGIEFNYDTDGAHTLDTVTVNSSGSGIVAARGLASVKSANITADDIGIAMGNKYGGSFQDLVISATVSYTHLTLPTNREV